jgi:sortase A
VTAVVERSRPPAQPVRSSPPPRAPQGRGLQVVTWALLSVACLALWTMLFTLSLSSLQEAHSQSTSYAKLREQLSAQTAPLGGPIAPGSPVALIDAPALGIRNLVVTEGTASGDLSSGPGHRRDTRLPGQAGTSVLFGRAHMFGAPFGQVDQAHQGDGLTAITGQGTFQYRVIDVRRVGEPLPPEPVGGSGRLVLVTAEGASAANLWQPRQPLYVDLDLIGAAAASPGVSVAGVPRAEQALQGDPSSLLLVVLWLPLLIVAMLLITWAAARWGTLQAYVAGAPVVLGALWGTTSAAVQLLPNVL